MIPPTFLLLCLLYASCHAANILYIIPFTSTSHYIVLRPIGLELARRGHNVTVITSHREDEHPPSYHQVVSDNVKIWELMGMKGRPNVFTMVDLSMKEYHKQVLWIGGTATTELALNSTTVKEFLKKENKFDLVISELFYQEATYMLAHRYGAPLVLVTTFGNSMRTNMLLRNPLQLATVLSEIVRIESPTSFIGRLRNLYYSIYEYIFWKYWYLPMQDALVDKYFKDMPRPLPSLEELHQNASLILINSHFSYDPPTAYLPNLVEIGGVHIKEKESKLSEDFQKILDDAKEGIVYVNFGSNVRSSELPLAKKNAFLNVFKKLKQTVLWKWEELSLENKPDNVVIKNWMPQKEILAHPNTKVFIAHGGLLGMQEAIFYGVPIIGVPIYGDQYNNLLLAEENGYGKILDYHDINEHSLERILNEVLKDDSFRRRAREMSLRFRDRPMSALDTAVFWIEYVIRHKGADFMKNPALKLNWFAFQMLDLQLRLRSASGFEYIASLALDSLDTGHSLISDASPTLLLLLLHSFKP
ncbi:UDP-glucuronosyltransferase 2B4 [Eumeta japonica]|uniref:UDP-glucuronosyltransferase n=1 Tax=Eumeta variegata TaxID=151549 RepID=A0A4C1XRA4_EUMVA|nr:UDP-glucuronosyltransferase 2B4 [Eumeta japonica]